MEIFSALKLIADMFSGLLGLLDRLVFRINGFEVSFGGMLFVTIVVLFVVGIFWKGAKA